MTRARLFASAVTLGGLLWMAACLYAASFPAIRSASPVVYGIGSAVCHQRPQRSFTVSGSQFPVCARCAALYASGAFAASAAWFGYPRAPKHTRALLLAAAMPTLASIPIEWLGLSPLSNSIRAAAAVPLGSAVGWTFVRSLRSEAMDRSTSAK